MMVVLFCGQSSYPRNDSATANRYRALAEMTAELGYEIIFVNRHPPLRQDESRNFNADFPVINSSGKFRFEGWLTRQLRRIFAVFFESAKIMRIAKNNSVKIINIYTQFALDLPFYYLISRLIGAKCVVHVTENRSQLSHRKALGKINDLLYDLFATSLFSRFITISSVLKEMVLANGKEVLVVSIPPVFRFEVMKSIPAMVGERPYFAYCASSAYEEVIWFVIQAYNSMENVEADLVLVINGSLSTRIEAACRANSRITLRSNVEYGQLLSLYKGALALLIPLRNTPQDIARYPQKITEYLASGRPIISTRFGEVGRHFAHQKTALLAQDYDVAQFAALMDFALSQPAMLDEIAKKGYQLGMQLFDSHAQSRILKLAFQ
ncbi:glycosyltransferase family 4 protein [Novosphingobium pituita]|uniref:glycosyltransferase family 4 protein n=1 Tax=Novosphingobium pituita TaxID=3056842 RepID=UPI00295EA98E|nr:glycosyltransferase family 4 protein [Novosphingobium sp. IK01]